MKTNIESSINIVKEIREQYNGFNQVGMWNALCEVIANLETLKILKEKKVYDVVYMKSCRKYYLVVGYNRNLYIPITKKQYYTLADFEL